MSKKITINSDKIIGISAMLISLLTLFIFLYQTNLLRKQSRLSVRPRLTFSKTIKKTVTLNDSDSVKSTIVNLRLTLRNNGLGPAIIESYKVVDKNDKYDIIIFFDTVYPKLKEYGVFKEITELEVGEAIPVSETIDVFSYQYNLINEKKIIDYLNIPGPYELPFSMLTEYSSMYEEKWIVDSNTKGHPKRLN